MGKLENLLKEDMIGKIYNNNIFFSEYTIQNNEYEKLTKSNVEISKYIIENSNNAIKNSFLQYIEQVSEKEAIEAEEQFKLGFKTAVKLIIEGLE